MNGEKVQVQRATITATGFCVVFLALLASLCLPSTYAQITANDSTKSLARRRLEIVQASRESDGLHKAALLSNGHFVKSNDVVPWNGVASLDEVVHTTPKIIVGFVVDSRSELFDNGRNIRTHFSVQVEDAMKGEVRSGEIVDFVQLGGTITFSDGAVAVVDMTKQPLLLKNHRYVLFANDSSQDKSLLPVGADESVFELNLDGHSVRPHASDHSVLRTTSQLTQDQFLSKIRDLVNRDKH
jgi:hypothetical protein